MLAGDKQVLNELGWVEADELKNSWTIQGAIYTMIMRWEGLLVLTHLIFQEKLNVYVKYPKL